MKKYLTKDLLFVFLISVVPVLLVLVPFLLGIKKFFFLDLGESGILPIVRNWDGPQFLIVAKSLYDPDIIVKLLFNALDTKYYAAHFPLFPLIVRAVVPLFGWFFSGIIINILFGFLTNILFYQLAKKYTKHPLLLTLIFTIFPARFWVVRSIVAPETLMLFFTLLSLWFWDQKRFLSSSLSGALAVLTKFQSLFLFPAYVAVMIEEKVKTRKWPQLSKWWVLLIPLSFVGLSIFYYFRFGDVNAFLHAQSNNNLSIYFPFSQFNYKSPWAGTGWLEDVALYFIAMIVLVTTLYSRKERAWFYFSLFYVIFLIFLPHRDIARYSIQLAPIFLLTFEQFFTSKQFKYALILGLPALYFYTINFIAYNQAPVADWGHFFE